MMTNLAIAQLEIPFLISRYKLNDSLGSQVAIDDISGLNLFIAKEPLKGLPSISGGDQSTCSAGYQTSTGPNNHWESQINVWSLVNGVSVEAIVCAESNHNAFVIFLSPSQFNLQVKEGGKVSWGVNVEKVENTLSTSSNTVLKGWPQHVVATYDLIAKTQNIYVDGSLVVSAPLSGQISIPTPTLQNVFMLFPSGAKQNIQAMAQDIAIYSGALSASRVKQHFEAFRQILTDPGHVRIFGQIGVES